MNHWCVKRILHLVPSKNLYICFCYISLHLPIIGQNLISAGHWDQYIVVFSRTPSLIPTIKILCPLLLYFLSLTRLGQHCVQSCRWKILPGQEHLDLFFKQRIWCKGELPFTLFEPIFFPWTSIWSFKYSAGFQLHIESGSPPPRWCRCSSLGLSSEKKTWKTFFSRNRCAQAKPMMELCRPGGCKMNWSWWTEGSTDHIRFILTHSCFPVVRPNAEFQILSQSSDYNPEYVYCVSVWRWTTLVRIPARPTIFVKLCQIETMMWRPAILT